MIKLIESEAYGYRTRVFRDGARVWCGHVVVPAGHPWHGMDEGDVRLVDLAGCCTFSGPDDDGAWAIGFDLGGKLTLWNDQGAASYYVSRLAGQAASAALTWSDERPTAEGDYWFRLGEGYGPTKARVHDVGGLELQVLEDGYWCRVHEDCGGQWAVRS